MGDLKSFLIDLALNPNLVQEYARDPRGTVERAGLTRDEAAAVISGDPAQLRTALGRPDNDCMSQAGIAVRHAETRRVLRLAEVLPLEKTVTLRHAIEMTLADGRTKRFEKGATVTRHRKAPVQPSKPGPRRRKRR